MQCEHCSQEHEFEESHSTIAVLQRVDTDGYTFHQCEQGQDYNGAQWQHWHCSHEHMKANFAACLNDHYAEEHLHPIPPGGGTTNMHSVVLASNLNCKVCQQPLTTVAYRFCITRCTPVNHVPDNSLDELANWCCSLEHARQSALAIIETLEEL
jgi:hypothetical protein